MWNVNLTKNPQSIPPPTHQAENSLMDRSTKPDISQWYHTTLFGPVKNYYPIHQERLPHHLYQLNNQPDQKYLPSSLATAKCHMHQASNNLQSTQQQYQQHNEEPPVETLPQ